MSEESLGERIKQARKRRKWSQATLAEKLGITTRTVLRWETKGDLPNYENQEGLIKYLGFREEDFRRQDQSMSETSEEETSASPTKVSEPEETLPSSETSEEETPASSVEVSELERILPPKEDFKMYCGRRIYVWDGKYGSRKTTYVTVNGRPLKDFGLHERNPEKEKVFEWGYSGAGPRRLAEALLADYLGESYPKGDVIAEKASNALLFGSLFKEDFIAQFTQGTYDKIDNDWQITSDRIRRWFYSLEEKGITRTTLLKRIFGEYAD